MAPRGKRAGAPTKERQKPKTASKKAAAAAKPEPAPKAGAKPMAPKIPPVAAALTPVQEQAFFHQNYRDFKRRKMELADKREEARAEVGSYREWLKERRREGHTLEMFETAAKIEADQGKSIRARWEMEQRVAGWLEETSQLTFEFIPDRTPAVDRAHGEGRAACFANLPRRSPYPVSTEQERAWYAGYDEGQAVLMKGFKAPQVPDEPTEAAPSDGYSDGQSDANGAADGKPVGSVAIDGDIDSAVDAAVDAEPITSGTPVTEYEAMGDNRDLRGTQQRQREADRDQIGTEMPTHETVQ